MSDAKGRSSTTAVYLTDLSMCTPASARSTDQRGDTWMVLDYETAKGQQPAGGRMIYAASYVRAPEVRLALDNRGWHHISIGVWNPHYPHDGGLTVKVKLSGDPCFTRISEPPPAMDASGTALQEVFFRTADLDGQDLHIGQTHGPFARKAAVAYIKLVPLSEAEISAINSPAAPTRMVAAVNDGITFFHNDEYRRREHLLELVEPYRHSDVKRVIWAFNYGDTTNYPSSAGAWIAGANVPPISRAPRNNDYIKGAKESLDALRRFHARRVIPQHAVERHVHALGLKFDAMFRLAVLGHIPPRAFHAGQFLKEHPECRQVTRDGLAIEKASYAFPETRQRMLEIIRESADRYNIDGAVLGFVRGPEFMLYEKPVIVDYRKELKRLNEKPEAAVPRHLLHAAPASRPPRIDGVLDEACWKSAGVRAGFTRSGGGSPRNETTVRAAFDRETLYLGVECAVRDVSKLKRDCPADLRSNAVWHDDSIEVRLSTDGGHTINQFFVSASGAWWPRRFADEKEARNLSMAVNVGKRAYTAEMAIPLRALGIREFRPGMPLLINIGREDRAGGREESALAEPYLELFRAPLIVLGTEAQFKAYPGSAELSHIDATDGRNAAFTDPVMQTVRCRHLTEFVRDARRVLDEVGARQGRRIEMTAWVYGGVAQNLNCGFDVERWIREGLLDGVIAFASEDPAEDRALLATARSQRCRYLAGMIPWASRHSPDATVSRAAQAYAAGADGIAVWDINGSQDRPDWWAVGKMLGHADKIEAWARSGAPQCRRIRLQRVAGCDVAEGLNAAIYSGG